jgi:hypothetical protein
VRHVHSSQILLGTLQTQVEEPTYRRYHVQSSQILLRTLQTQVEEPTFRRYHAQSSQILLGPVQTQVEVAVMSISTRTVLNSGRRTYFP